MNLAAFLMSGTSATQVMSPEPSLRYCGVLHYPRDLYWQAFDQVRNPDRETESSDAKLRVDLKEARQYIASRCASDASFGFSPLRCPASA